MTEYMYNVLARYNRFDLRVRNILAADPVNLRDLLAVATKRSVHRRSVTGIHARKHHATLFSNSQCLHGDSEFFGPVDAIRSYQVTASGLTL